MTTEKKSAIIYSDWIEQFESLSDEEAGKLIKHLMRYINDLNPKAPDRMTELLFIPIQQCINRDKAKWNERAERSRANGHKGGRPQSKEDQTKDNQDNPLGYSETQDNPLGYSETQETQEVFSEPKKPDNVNVNVNVNVNDNGNVIEEEKEIIKENAVFLYDLYPTRCPVRDASNNKGEKDKLKLEKILKTKTVDEMQELIQLYVEDCKNNKIYMKHFSSFLNNLPDKDSFKKTAPVPTAPPQPVDDRDIYQYFQYTHGNNELYYKVLRVNAEDYFQRELSNTGNKCIPKDEISPERRAKARLIRT